MAMKLSRPGLIGLDTDTRRLVCIETKRSRKFCPRWKLTKFIRAADSAPGNTKSAIRIIHSCRGWKSLNGFFMDNPRSRLAIRITSTARNTHFLSNDGQIEKSPPGRSVGQPLRADSLASIAHLQRTARARLDQLCCDRARDAEREKSLQRSMGPQAACHSRNLCGSRIDCRLRPQLNHFDERRSGDCDVIGLLLCRLGRGPGSACRSCRGNTLDTRIRRSRNRRQSAKHRSFSECIADHSVCGFCAGREKQNRFWRRGAGWRLVRARVFLQTNRDFAGGSHFGRLFVLCRIAVPKESAFGDHLDRFHRGKRMGVTVWLFFCRRTRLYIY